MDISSTPLEEQKSSTEQSEYDDIVRLLRTYRHSLMENDGLEHDPDEDVDARSEGQAQVYPATSRGTTQVSCGPPAHHSAESDKREAHSSVDPLSDLSPLPQLEDPDWLVPAKKKGRQCRNWNKNHCCQHGRKCFYFHRHGPWNDLESVWNEMTNHKFPLSQRQFQMWIQHMSKRVGDKEWFTAGFAKVVPPSTVLPSEIKDLDIFYAEGGNGRISSQGVWWYTSKMDACSALEKVVTVSLWAAEVGRTPLAFQHHPHSANVPVPVTMSHKRHSFAAPSHYGPRDNSQSCSHYQHHNRGESNNRHSPPEHPSGPEWDQHCDRQAWDRHGQDSHNHMDQYGSQYADRHHDRHRDEYHGSSQDSQDYSYYGKGSGHSRRY